MPTSFVHWMTTLGLILVPMLGMTNLARSQTDNRMAICHKDAERQTWTLTMTPGDEAREHLATHPADGQPGHPVPGQSGYIFDAECRQITECSCVALGDQPLWGSETISEDCLQVEADLNRMVQVTNLAEVWYLSGQWYLADQWLRNPSKDIVLPARRRTCRSTP